jgi:hypothetical protein
MGDGYETVFVVSYFSGASDLIPFGLLAVGLLVLLFGRPIFERKFARTQPAGCGTGFWLVWCVLWLAVATLGVGVTLVRGWTYTAALRDGRAEVVEGAVKVLHWQPASGHAPGDLVEVGGRVFRVNFFHTTQAYSRTLAHGGDLNDGVRVRLHHLDGAILKVEVAR